MPTSKPETRAQAAEILKAHGGSLRQAAAACGMVRSTFTRLLRAGEPGEKSGDRARVVYLRRKIAELETQLSRREVDHGRGQELVHELRQAVVSARPVALQLPSIKPPGSPCAMVLHLTDWHYGGVQEADEVDGFGEFSPAIAISRVAKLAAKITAKVIAQRAAYVVPELRVICTGDFVSGDIHHELSVTNAFPVPVQAVRCGYLLGGLLVALAPHFERIVVDFVTLDNHSRLTVKPQASQGGLNTWGYVVAEVAAQHVKAQENIVFNIHAKPSALVVVGPERYLAFHGHQIRGWSGKPYYGFDRRAAMEAVKRMGIPDQAYTKLLMGHFHVAANGDLWILGGSLSGTDANDHNNGRHANPHQTSWFVHPTNGEFDYTRWWL